MTDKTLLTTPSSEEVRAIAAYLRGLDNHEDAYLIERLWVTLQVCSREEYRQRSEEIPALKQRIEELENENNRIGGRVQALIERAERAERQRDEARRQSIEATMSLEAIGSGDIDDEKITDYAIGEAARIRAMSAGEGS